MLSTGNHENERQPDMTSHTLAGSGPARLGGLAGRCRSALRKLSARAHADGDARARAMGWTITPTTGRLGLSGRTYRDPRFDTRRRRRAA